VPTQGEKRSGLCVRVTGEQPPSSHTHTHTHTHTLTLSHRVPCVQLRNLVSALSRDSVTKVVVFRSLVPGVFCAGEFFKIYLYLFVCLFGASVTEDLFYLNDRVLLLQAPT